MIVSRSSINVLARIDAVEHDYDQSNKPVTPPVRYETPYIQELYEQYFWSNLRDIRGESVVHQGQPL